MLLFGSFAANAYIQAPGRNWQTQSLIRSERGQSSTDYGTDTTESRVSPLIGNVKQNVAPRGGLSAAHKRPPCDSTMVRLIDNPMPLPWGLVVKNTSKICSVFSLGNPMPVSLTEISSWPSAASCVLTVRTPP